MLFLTFNYSNVFVFLSFLFIPSYFLKCWSGVNLSLFLVPGLLVSSSKGWEDRWRTLITVLLQDKQQRCLLSFSALENHISKGNSIHSHFHFLLLSFRSPIAHPVGDTILEKKSYFQIHTVCCFLRSAYRPTVMMGYILPVFVIEIYPLSLKVVPLTCVSKLSLETLYFWGALHSKLIHSFRTPELKISIRMIFILLKPFLYWPST